MEATCVQALSRRKKGVGRKLRSRVQGSPGAWWTLRLCVAGLPGDAGRILRRPLVVPVLLDQCQLRPVADGELKWLTHYG